MKFDPQTKRLYTDDLQLIKRLNCPLHKKWEDLQETKDIFVRCCDACKHPVIDTAYYTDDALKQLVTSHPQTCVKVDLDQMNLAISYEDAIRL